MKIKRTIAVSLGAAALVLGAAAPALAVQVGGGTWYHGTTGTFGGGTVYSEYDHNYNCHTATVINADGERDKDWASAGYWAYASENAYSFQVDYSYWNNEC